VNPDRLIEAALELANQVYYWAPPEAAQVADEALALAKALAQRVRELEGALESATARLARAEDEARRYRDALYRVLGEAEGVLRR